MQGSPRNSEINSYSNRYPLSMNCWFTNPGLHSKNLLLHQQYSNTINSCQVRNNTIVAVRTHWGSDDLLCIFFGEYHLKTDMTASHHLGMIPLTNLTNHHLWWGRSKVVIICPDYWIIVWRKPAASKDLSCGTKITERLPGCCRRRRSNKDLLGHVKSSRWSNRSYPLVNQHIT